MANDEATYHKKEVYAPFAELQPRSRSNLNIRKFLTYTTDVPNDDEQSRSSTSYLYTVKPFFSLRIISHNVRTQLIRHNRAMAMLRE